MGKVCLISENRRVGPGLAWPRVLHAASLGEELGAGIRSGGGRRPTPATGEGPVSLARAHWRCPVAQNSPRLEQDAGPGPRSCVPAVGFIATGRSSPSVSRKGAHTATRRSRSRKRRRGEAGRAVGPWAPEELRAEAGAWVKGPQGGSPGGLSAGLPGPSQASLHA